ncbi:hypothetical protein J7T55_007585 [Diaporthe amygdali]|uniref:uncharacterized protein n=1 Tax=Phomopsis amygdali TaxID=1214568 RepID=UPI0022FE0EFA|nr:uncharacterized protein J7T55_007585 [Diaporthe amygdali]KAJ0107215.1 hypothetical protein J7T55_007585 [Diaporthe amygdali]
MSRNNIRDEDYLDEDYLDEESSEDEDISLIEMNALHAATQNSLKSFAQEREEACAAAAAATAATAAGVGPAFTSTKVAEDDRKREEELYGPPSPPRQPCGVTPPNPAAKAFTQGAANTSSTTSKADDSWEPASNVVDSRFTAVKRGAQKATASGHATRSQMPSESSIADLEWEIFGQPSQNESTHTAESPTTEQFAASQLGTSADAAVGQHVSDTASNNLPAVVGSIARLDTPSSHVDASAAATSTAASDANEFRRRGQLYDDATDRARAARLAAIEQALNRGSAYHEAVLEGRHSGGAFVSVAEATGPQAAHVESGPASAPLQEAGRPVPVGGPDWFLDGSPASPRHGDEQVQSPRQHARPRYGNFDFGADGKPRA